MNLIQLKYFQTVSNFQNMTKASEFLNITQPSLSLAIKELEREFGVTLFYRHRHGIALTDEGRELLSLADGLLSHAEQVERRMTDLGVKRKVLRLGVPPMTGAILITSIYNDFALKNTDIQLEIFETGRQELMNMLCEDRLDLVFLPHNSPFDSSFKSQKVSPFEIVFCTKKGTNQYENKSIAPQDLIGKPLVLFKDSFFQTNQIKKWFAKAEVEPKIALQTDQLSTMQKIIASGYASGFMFKDLVEANDEIQTYSLSENIPVNISLVWKATAPTFQAMRRFIDFMKNKNLNN